MRRVAFSLALVFSAAAQADAPPAMSAQQVIDKVLESDPWGLSGAEVTAHAVLKDKRGATSELAFSARSKRYDPPLSKSLVRFSAPADLAGAGFLQVQKRGDDDDRYLFMPDLKKSRRISGNLRASAFMGTDFSFADLDRRDLREAEATLLADENVGKFPCFHLEVRPKRGDSQYSRAELWVRKDSFLPLKWTMYDKAKVLLKTLTADEVRRVNGHWFITKSHMVNHLENHRTDMFLEQVKPRDDIPDDDFTVRMLEKI
jgi:outer membrane lipoprotein-sorting protein